MENSTFHEPWPLKCYIQSKCSHKVLSLGPNLWPQFKLREICGEQGLFASGCACNTQSPDARLYFFLLHLSIGTCPLLPQISLAWSHYTTLYPLLRENGASSFNIFVFQKKSFQTFFFPFLFFVYFFKVRNLGLFQFLFICHPVAIPLIFSHFRCLYFCRASALS